MIIIVALNERLIVDCYDDLVDLNDDYLWWVAQFKRILDDNYYRYQLSLF